MFLKGDTTMTKEQFLEIGLTEEQAKTAAEKSAEELKGYVPKERFTEVNEAKKKAEADVEERDAQIEEIKKSAGDNEALRKQIEELQDASKEAEQKYQEELKDAKLTNAIKLAITGKAHDEDMVANLFDKSKLVLSDDGKVVGIEEQLKTLKEGKSFLFKEEQKDNKPGFHKVGGNPPGEQGEGNVSLKDAIAAHFQQ